MTTTTHLIAILEHLTLGVIPWWFYVMASCAAAGVIIAEVPTRLGLVLGLVAALVLGDVGWASKGYHEGAAARDAWWANQAKAEQDRLREQFTGLLKQETARADAAEANNKELQGRVHDAEASVRDANGNPAAAVVPADVARKLYDLAPAAGGSADSPTRRAFGPFPLPRLLRLHR